MRVFITGASGHVASAVVPELLNHGHQVLGLARSDESAAKVSALGAEVRRGDITDLDLLSKSAAEADGVIHLAFRHDIAFSGDFAGAADSDQAAIKVIGQALAGSGKPFIGTGGSLFVAGEYPAKLGTEQDAGSGPNPRTASERALLGLSSEGVRSANVRLAPVVHSDLDKHGFISILINFARENGFAAYVGEGKNRWPGANTRDIGVLYRLALEKAPAGSALHGVESEGYAFRTIAEAIAAKLGLEARSISAEEANQRLGFLAQFAQADNPTSNRWTRETLGWEPTHPGLLEDLAAEHYFSETHEVLG
ncbi:MAG: SDR family oxidoreductase [Solirubrobacterales bacterium]|nr:SDR family oxidoreductase [Solirubrobacterales bacterium]